jgi:indole-3-glycerol phosphate synthase
MALSTLDRILEEKRREVAERRRLRPLEAVERQARGAPPPRGFEDALRPTSGGGPRIIAEIKRASPSKGLIRPDFDAAWIARRYEAGGAAALSVLTDAPFFQGALEHLAEARAAVRVPVLRKEFIIDPYQVWEARAAGADAILLIATALADGELADLDALARDLGIDVLFEVHDRAEMERARRLGAGLVGINNRDLRTFEVRLETSRELLPLRPPGALAVSESGIFERRDVDLLTEWGADAFLIGESLMRAADPGAALAALIGGEG